MTIISRCATKSTWAFVGCPTGGACRLAPVRAPDELHKDRAPDDTCLAIEGARRTSTSKITTAKIATAQIATAHFATAQLATAQRCNKRLSCPSGHLSSDCP